MAHYLKSDFTAGQIADCIAANQPWKLKSFQRIPTGKYNVTYSVELEGRAIDAPGEAILRIAPPDDTGGTFYEIGMMAQEPEIHDIVRRHTSIPAAKIYTHDTSRRVIDRDFLIMEKLPGRPLSQVGGLTMHFHDGVLEQVGVMLGELHRITRTRFGYLGAHQCMEPQESWADAFAVMWNKLIDDIVATGAYSEDEAAMLREAHRACADVFDRDIPASLLHMDIWGQNILVDSEGNVTGLVDWDRALWGDPEIEFAVLDYCGVSQPAFWRGYGEERDESRAAGIRGLFYYLYEVQKYIVIEIERRQNRSAAMGYKQNVIRMIQRAFG